MEQKEMLLCRLCLNTISNEHFEDLGEIVIKTLEVLQLTLNFDIGKGHVVCSNCMASIQKYLDFKSTYLNAEDYIVSLYNFETESKLDLREMYVHKNKHMVAAEIARDQEICRLCMELKESSSCKSLLEIEDDMLEKCIPELNFNLTKEPVLCDSCLNSLKLNFQFLQTCMDTEEKIIEYYRFEATDSKSQIDLHKVVKFTKNVLENEKSIIKVNIDLDGLRGGSEENNVIKTEIKVENENVEFDGENNIKVDVEENIKIEVSEDSLEIQNGELDMIYKQNVDLDGLYCERKEKSVNETEIEGENENREFDRSNIEKDIKTNIDANTTNREIHEHPLKLQTEELETIYKHNGVPTKQTNFESFRDGPIPFHYVIKNTNVCNPDHTVTHQVSSEAIPQNLENTNKIKIVYNYRNPSEVTVYRCEDQELSEVKVYTCKSCSYVTKCEGNLKRHTLVHEPLQTTLHHCNQCSYETKYKQVLKIHMLTHEQPTMYKCERCSYESIHEGNFKRHVQFYHKLSEITVYKCHQCAFETKYKQSLESHNLIHRAYSCEHCSYTTDNKMTLKQHKFVHLVGVYNCGHCSYRTVRKSNLKSHIMQVHLAFFKCRHCSFYANSKKSLKMHSWTHLEPERLVLSPGKSYRRPLRDVRHHQSQESEITVTNMTDVHLSQKTKNS